MGETSNKDDIKEIIDKDNEEIPLITFSSQKILKIKKQINIYYESNDPDFKLEISNLSKIKNFNFGLKNPSPCQYCIIADKPKSLNALINFSCNRDENYHLLARQGNEEGLKLDPEYIFFPKNSLTPWPLLHLAVALGRKECLQVLIEFLSNQKKLHDFINRPDSFLMTPLTVAFATGIEDTIHFLLNNEAEPYYSKNIVMPIIFTILYFPSKVETAIKCIESANKNEGFNAFEPIKNLFYDDNGIAHQSQVDGSKKFEFLFDDKIEIKNLYAQQERSLDTIKTLSENDEQNNNNNAKKIVKNSKCTFQDCRNVGTKCCPKCNKVLCSDHMNLHQCI